MSKTVEIRVRPVTRWIVTRFEQEGRSAGCEGMGEFDSVRKANEIADALGRREPEAIVTFAEDEHYRGLRGYAPPASPPDGDPLTSDGPQPAPI